MVDEPKITLKVKLDNIFQMISNKVTSWSQTPSNDKYPSEKLVKDNLDLKENLSNKTNSITDSSTNTQYPSAKGVYDKCETKLDKLQRTVTTFNPIDYVVGENGAVWNNDNSITLPNNGSNITFNFTDMLNDTGDYFEWELGVSHGTIYINDEEHMDEIWDSNVNSSIRIRITKNEYSESYHITTTDLSNNTIIKDYDKDYQFNLKFGTMNGCTFHFSSKKWYHTVSFIDMIYPIGSIYMGVNSINPSLFIGGTWEQIKDTFLLATGDTYANGSTGGEATHTLTTNEMPSHTHIQNSHNHTQNAHNHRANNEDTTRKILVADKNVFITTKRQYTSQTTTTGLYYVQADADTTISEYDHLANTTATNNSQTATNQSSGGGQAHNNMPPYLAVYMWKRVG